MLESQPVVAFVMNDDSEPPAVEKHDQQLVSALAVLGKNSPVVHHPSSIPIHIAWLESQGFIHASNHNSRTPAQKVVRRFEGPKTPTEARVAVSQIKTSVNRIGVNYGTEKIFWIGDTG